MNYFTMEHKGGLKESVETCKPLEEWTFRKLLESGIYKHYSYDERIKATRYILKHMSSNYGLPTYIIKCDGNPIQNYYKWKGIFYIEVKL